jgi:hypothetical protein
MLAYFMNSERIWGRKTLLSGLQDRGETRRGVNRED